MLPIKGAGTHPNNCPQLIAVAPLPDELDRSYLGALIRANSLSSEDAIYGVLAQAAGGGKKPTNRLARVELLSVAAKVSLSTFIRNHTTMPLRRAIVSVLPHLEYAEMNLKILRNSGMQLTRPAAYLCEKCVQEDIAFHGRSYWRRQHQIPGLFWCTKHLSELRYTDGEHAFISEPADFLNSSNIVEEKWLLNQRNQAVLNFLSISSALMDREAPIGVSLASMVLRHRAEILGHHTLGTRVVSSWLSDAMLNAFGREWLEATMPSIAGKRPGESINRIDGVLFPQRITVFPTAYILAMALLFDTAEEALNALIHPEFAVLSDKNSAEAPDAKSHEPHHIGTCSRGDQPCIASSYRSCSTGLLTVDGIQDGPLKRAALNFFRDGLSISESATAQNVDFQTLQNLVLRFGAPLFSSSV